MIASTDPAMGVTFARFDAHKGSQIEARLSTAHRAQAEWRRTPIFERTGLLRRLAALLHEQSASLAMMIMREMGKPLGEAFSEVENGARNWPPLNLAHPLMTQGQPLPS